MKKVLSFVAALFAVAVMFVSCASKSDKMCVEMLDAANAKNTAKVEALFNQIGEIDEAKLSAEAKVALVYGAIYLAGENRQSNPSKFEEYREIVLGIIEGNKTDPEFVKFCNEVKSGAGVDVLALADDIKEVIFDETLEENTGEEAAGEEENAGDEAAE